MSTTAETGTIRFAHPVRDTVEAAVRARADLKYADLTYADLAGANVAGVDLKRADLTRANLAGANLTRAELSGAILDHADLTHADLYGADLSGANLAYAKLYRANLGRTELSGAILDHADLTHADLYGADLSGANLEGVELTGANLDGANLYGVDLTRANLEPIRADLYEVLAAARDEVPGLLDRIKAGRIDGSSYGGECACLVGSLARERGVRHTEIPGLTPDHYRPAERWFLAIRPGDTPMCSKVAAITADWVRGWLRERMEEAP